MEMTGGRSFRLLSGALVCALIFGVGAGENAGPELAVELSGPTQATIGTPLVISATVTNRGSAPAPRAELRVRASDSLPLELESEAPSGGAVCTREPADSGFVLECGPWTIAPGETQTVALTFRVRSDELTTVSVDATSGVEPGDVPAARRAELVVNQPIYRVPAELAPPALLTRVLPAAYLREPYSARIDVESASPPVRFQSCGRMPSQLTLSPEGFVTGTPIDFGNFRLCVTMQDARGNGAVDIVTIYTVPRWQLIAKPLPFPSAIAGKPFDVPIAMGGRPPYSAIINGRLPPGVTFDPATGHIAGTPRQSGPFRFMFWLQDADGHRSLARNALFLYAYPGFPTSAHPALTPGATVPAVRKSTLVKTVCSASWLKRHSRRAPPSLLAELLVRYGLPPDATGYAVDALVPVQLGGAARDLSNLWPAPMAAARKQAAEAEQMRRRVCSGRMSLAAAREQIVKMKREPPVERR